MNEWPSWWAAVSSTAALPLDVPMWVKAIACVSITVNAYVYARLIDPVPNITYIYGSTIEGSEHA